MLDVVDRYCACMTPHHVAHAYHILCLHVGILQVQFVCVLACICWYVHTYCPYMMMYCTYMMSIKLGINIDMLCMYVGMVCML